MILIINLKIKYDIIDFATLMEDFMFGITLRTKPINNQEVEEKKPLLGKDEVSKVAQEALGRMPQVARTEIKDRLVTTNPDESESSSFEPLIPSLSL